MTRRLSPGAVLLFCACGTSLDAPRAAFHEGRLPAAARGFQELEAKAVHFPPAERAEYALFRGLTYLGLGDSALAERFIGEAFALETKHPGCLDRAERGALAAALRSMGRAPGEAFSATAAGSARVPPPPPRPTRSRGPRSGP